VNDVSGHASEVNVGQKLRYVGVGKVEDLGFRV